MIYTPKLLANGALSDTPDSTIYTADEEVTDICTIIKEIIINNVTTGAVTVSLSIGGGVIFTDLPIQAKETKIYSLSTILNPGLLIEGSCSSGISAMFTISGIRVAS